MGAVDEEKAPINPVSTKLIFGEKKKKKSNKVF